MLDELQLTYTSYNGQNLNSPAVSVIRGSTVLKCISENGLLAHPSIARLCTDYASHFTVLLTTLVILLYGYASHFTELTTLVILLYDYASHFTELTTLVIFTV
jgi:hypothetical protein